MHRFLRQSFSHALGTKTRDYANAILLRSIVFSVCATLPVCIAFLSLVATDVLRRGVVFDLLWVRPEQVPESRDRNFVQTRLWLRTSQSLPDFVLFLWTSCRHLNRCELSNLEFAAVALILHTLRLYLLASLGDDVVACPSRRKTWCG